MLTPSAYVAVVKVAIQKEREVSGRKPDVNAASDATVAVV
ncbi:hypothetical protein L585_05600 [Pantoea ananatis BRT175]|jgi:hypothetical protein|nr:hypothetical protein L585_05600 [Pantoea ananatis BRT175]PKC44900.1 hypothetical protein V461_07115 [Pantoea ananatis BRT98]